MLEDNKYMKELQSTSKYVLELLSTKCVLLIHHRDAEIQV